MSTNILTTQNGWQNISRDECRAGGPIALANADRHMRCAQMLADHGEYGIAMAHLVLAGEEGLKAVVLHLKASGAPVTDSMIRIIMRRHEPRHNAYVIIRLFRLVLTLLGSVADAPDAESAEQALHRAKDALEAMADDRPFPEQRQDVTMMEWWRDAESLKQAGFYVDYAGGGVWRSPGNVGAEAYSVANEVVRVELADAERLIETIYAVPAELQANWNRAMEGLQLKLAAGRVSQSGLHAPETEGN